MKREKLKSIYNINFVQRRYKEYIVEDEGMKQSVKILSRVWKFFGE